MSVKIYKTGDIEKQGIKCLVYGKSGIGKTKLLSTAPKPIIISSERGLRTIKKENIPYMSVSTVEEIYEALNYLNSDRMRKRYKTIGIDTISEMGETVLCDHKAKNKDPRKAYMALQEEMNDLIRNFRDLSGYDVVMNAKRSRVKDEDTGLTQYIASMPGQALPQGLPYFFDEVFYMDFHEKDNGSRVRVLRTDANLEYDAKDRSGKLRKMELPNLTKIFNKISKGDK